MALSGVPADAPPPGAPDAGEVRAAILALLDRRAPGRTICPSEAARVLGGDAGFRAWMDPVRAAAAELAAAGELEVTQRGLVVDPARARGPIRLRRRHPQDGHGDVPARS